MDHRPAKRHARAIFSKEIASDVYIKKFCKVEWGRSGHTRPSSRSGVWARRIGGTSSLSTGLRTSHAGRVCRDIRNRLQNARNMSQTVSKRPARASKDGKKRTADPLTAPVALPSRRSVHARRHTPARPPNRPNRAPRGRAAQAGLRPPEHRRAQRECRPVPVLHRYVDSRTAASRVESTRRQLRLPQQTKSPNRCGGNARSRSEAPPSITPPACTRVVW